MGTKQRTEIDSFAFIARSTYLRPRDFVKYLQACAQEAAETGGIIRAATIRKVDTAFSNYLKDELRDELFAILADISVIFDVISQIGKISYVVRSFVGDGTVKKEVIARYLQGEQQLVDGPSTVGITPDNYKFKYKGSMSNGGRMVHILALTPRRKSVGLFKGELWLDTETYLPIRETGRLVKTPSVFLKKVEFTRDYAIRNGIAFPSHIESKVDARLVGVAQLSINFTNIGPAEAEDASLSELTQN